MSRKEAEGGIVRRDFIKGAAMGAGAATMMGLGAIKGEAAAAPRKWDEEADVVIVGYGLAGAVAAIAAHDGGAKVLILEKMAKGKEGGNSRCSGNNAYLTDNGKDALAYLKAMAAGHLHGLSDELFAEWAQETVENKAILEKMGFKVEVNRPAEHTDLPGASTQAMYTVMKEGLPQRGGLFQVFAREVAARKIPVRYQTPAKKLVSAGNRREVRGVIADNKGKEVTVKARKGVILTCGGFEFNAAMLANYGRAPVVHLGSPANTGDGILMAMELGADLWHMNNIMGPFQPGFLTGDLGPEFSEIPFGLQSVPGKTFLWTDKYGKRFMDESRRHQHGFAWDAINYYDGIKIEYPRIPWWIVFDEDARKKGPLATSGWAVEFSGYEWSKDNSAEVAKGWILKGDTPDELAAAMKLDPVVLRKTIERFNSDAGAGGDKEFGRKAGSMAPLKGPFYAIKSWPASVNTQGGPKRNQKGQIVDVWGKAIPRLYSGGELGSFYAWLYQGGGSMSECLGARSAGKNAAAEASWK